MAKEGDGGTKEDGGERDMITRAHAAMGIGVGLICQVMALMAMSDGHLVPGVLMGVFGAIYTLWAGEEFIKGGE